MQDHMAERAGGRSRIMPTGTKLEIAVRWMLIPPALYYAGSYYLGLLWFGDPTWRGLLMALALSFAAAVTDEALAVNAMLRYASVVLALAALIALALPGTHDDPDRVFALSVMTVCLVHFMFRVYRHARRARVTS